MQPIIQEGSFSDILSKVAGGAKTIVDASTSKDDNDVYLKGSISRYTKDLVMSFPMLCDNSLPVSTVTMINKANERTVISMLQMLFSAINMQGTNGVDILKALHKNISNPNMEDIMDALDSLSESVNFSSYERALFEAHIRDIAKMIQKENLQPAPSYPVSSFSEHSLSDFTAMRRRGDLLITELTDAEEDYLKKKKDLRDSRKDRREEEKRGEEREKAQRDKDKYESDTKNQKHDREQDEENLLTSINTKRLVDSDVKKANEIQPSLMVVNYYSSVDGSTQAVQKSFVAGVKSRAISVDAIDIVDRLIAKDRAKLSFVNLVRAHTKEISLFKDLIFCTKQAKLDAKNAVKKGPAAQIWNLLSVRSAKGAFNKFRRKGNDATAITGLVVSAETVEYMKKVHKFDLMKPQNTKLIMQAYNLMSIWICDETTEAVHYIMDGNNSYEVVSYNGLEKEGAGREYKKMVNLLASNGR